MSNSRNALSDAYNQELPLLSAETREALNEAARCNGRTVHEEAEHIIKTHVAASGEDDN